jgi:WD40 repeat protein
MKQSLFFLAALLTLNLASRAADEYATGYIITKNNDTVLCKILIPKDFGHFNEPSLFLRVTVLDNSGEKKKYTPATINGYVFIYNAKKYVYASKQIDDDGKTMFAWPRNLGKKINEYYYYSYNSTDLAKGATGSLEEVYVLEDPETKGTVAITRGGAWTNNFKEQLRKFFENDKHLLTLINKEVKEFHDIPMFVKDANNE